MNNCEHCGHFTWSKYAVTYTPYGGYWDFEQPPEAFICTKCWAEYSEFHKDLTRKVSWQITERR